VDMVVAVNEIVDLAKRFKKAYELIIPGFLDYMMKRSRFDTKWHA